MMDIAEPYSAESLSGRFRRARFHFFRDLVESIRQPSRDIQILDVGGVEGYWELNDYLDGIHVTVLNLEAEPTRHANVVSIAGDARDLSRFEDKSFDLVFSNSVIEHVGTYTDQQRMADEVRRVGRNYFVQTPNFWFPVEPHAVFPAFHWLPVGVRASLLQHRRLGHLYPRPDRQDALELVRSIRLVRESELRRMFPDGRIWHEKFYGLTKSLTVYHFSG